MCPKQGEKPVALAITLGGALTLHLQVVSKPGQDWLQGRKECGRKGKAEIWRLSEVLG